MVRINKDGGGYKVIETTLDQWFWGEPTDIAVCQIHEIGDAPRLRSVQSNLWLTESDVDDLDVGLGDDVFMVGRFKGRDGKARNIPVTRFGTICAMPDPNELIEMKRVLDQEAFLAEMRSYSGFSGSPVFMYRNFALADVGRVPPKLLGVDLGHYPETREATDDRGRKYNIKLERNVAVVSPIWKLKQLLERKDVVELREKAEQEEIEERKKGGVAVPDSAEEELTREEFHDALEKATEPEEEPSGGETA